MCFALFWLVQSVSGDGDGPVFQFTVALSLALSCALMQKDHLTGRWYGLCGEGGGGSSCPDRSRVFSKWCWQCPIIGCGDDELLVLSVCLLGVLALCNSAISRWRGAKSNSPGPCGRACVSLGGVLAQAPSKRRQRVGDHKGVHSIPIFWYTGGAYRALCARCAKSWLFSTTGSSVSSED